MDLDIEHDRICVISDIHLGSPLFNDINTLQSFIRHVRKEKMHLCINGDGLDITQSSIARMAREIPIIFNELIGMRDDGLNIYYVVGNHDIIFEYFLRDWGLFKVVPFINLTSNDKLIRIEHSHIYDKLYMTSPSMYKIIEIIGGFLLRYTPPIYRSMLYIERFIYDKKVTDKKSKYKEHSSFIDAVDNLLERGFDAVIFGHTHRPGIVRLDDEKTYINLGAWAQKPYFAKIIHGNLDLCEYNAQ